MQLIASNYCGEVTTAIFRNKHVYTKQKDTKPGCICKVEYKEHMYSQAEHTTIMLTEWNNTWPNELILKHCH